MLDPTMQGDETQEPADKITVCIEIDADGTISVGAKPPEGDDGADSAGQGDPGMTDLSEAPDDDESEEASYMRPVKSIDQALAVARDLLQNAGQVGPAMEQGAADTAFQSRRGGKGGY